MKGKFPNGLAAAMEKAGIGPTELAYLGKTSKQNIDRWANGSRKLTAPWADILAPPLHVEPEQLLFPGRRVSTRKVPHISWVNAGKIADVEGVTNVDAKKHITVADLPQGVWIALTVDGDSMNLIAPPGAVILVNRADDRLLDDRFYVFATGEGAATFKRYRSGPTRLQPYSTNPDHETLYPGEILHVVGRVRRVITELK